MDYEKRRSDLADVLKTQGADGNWDYDSYMCGMFNGLELAASIMEGRTPKFRGKPDSGWLYSKTMDDRIAAAGHTPSPENPVLEAYVYEAQKSVEVDQL